MKKFYLLPILAATSCGRPTLEGNALDSINAIQSALGLGRNVAISHSYLSTPTSQEMFAVERDSGSGAVTKITFDHSKTEAIAAKDISANALQWILDHADQLGVQTIEIASTPTVRKLNDSLVSLSF